MNDKHVLFLTAVLLSSVCAVGPSRADPLGKDACSALKAEVATLEATGLKDEMEKGPDWAKANMAPERLRQVARYIEIEEQISFRCRVLAVPPRKKPVAAKDPAAKDVKPPAAADAAGAPAAQPKPVVKRPPQAQAPAAKVKKPQAKTGLFDIE